MPYFEYGQKEIDYLKKKDKKLGAAIERIGFIEREIKPDVFLALVDSIISQQISTKAADTVLERLCNLIGDITPENIAVAEIEQIQQCGMTMKKAGYIKSFAETVSARTLNLEELRVLSDTEVIKKLVELDGVGVWTAEMLLLFSLCRPDVVSYGDLAIRRGMMNLYGLKELPKAKFERYKKRYSPYGSVASLYLWNLAVL
ncbi:MAG: DNA-3-methyladenine glycosylase 2 family protein [Negativicutes bacterium]|nr:DNA-3-methyladenine glycosylase 2 family protein [Negativicutes bacterium]